MGNLVGNPSERMRHILEKHMQGGLAREKGCGSQKCGEEMSTSAIILGEQ